MITMEPGVLYIGPADPDIYCPRHRGPMRLNFAMDRYRCAGFDGEGCPNYVDMEDLLEPLGTAGQFHASFDVQTTITRDRPQQKHTSSDR